MPGILDNPIAVVAVLAPVVVVVDIRLDSVDVSADDAACCFCC